MASFDQLHQLLEQSLRDIQTEANHEDTVQDKELSEALHRLSGRLNDILAESPSDVEQGESVESSLAGDDASACSPVPRQENLHLVTSCEGVVIMANDLVCDVLGLDLAALGSISLSQWIPLKEWRVIHPRLSGVLEPMKWVVTFHALDGVFRRVPCIITPMFDHSRAVTGWHWGLQWEHERAVPSPFPQLVQSLEAQILAGQNVEVCLTQICEGLVHTFGFPFVWIATSRENHVLELQAYGVNAELDWDLHGSRWWQGTVQHEELLQACSTPTLAPVLLSKPSHEGLPWFPQSFNLHEALRIPLHLQEGSTGMLVVCSSSSNVFDASVQSWLRALGHQIEGLMASAYEMEQLRLKSAALGSVNYAVCVTDPQGRLQWMNEAYAELMGVPTSELLGDTLSSFPHEHLQAAADHSSGSLKSLGVLKTEIIEERPGKDDVVLEQVLTPLLNEEGVPTHFVAILQDVTARKATERQMTYQAYHDPLTDLPNRVMFDDRLQQALAHARRKGSLLALLFLDLDNFKSINDQHGHPVGDRLLRIVAKRLQSCVRSTDTVSRLSGDEFAIILQDLEHIPDIRQVSQKILDSLQSPVRLGGHDLGVQSSIGISVYPKDAVDGFRLLEIADQAMYSAKESGGQCWHFATSEWNFEESF